MLLSHILERAHIPCHTVLAGFETTPSTLYGNRFRYSACTCDTVQADEKPTLVRGPCFLYPREPHGTGSTDYRVLCFLLDEKLTKWLTTSLAEATGILLWDLTSLSGTRELDIILSKLLIASYKYKLLTNIGKAPSLTLCSTLKH